MNDLGPRWQNPRNRALIEAVYAACRRAAVATYGAGGVTFSTNDPKAPLNPSTTMVYVWPAATACVILDRVPQKSLLHLSWLPRHPPLRMESTVSYDDPHRSRVATPEAAGVHSKVRSGPAPPQVLVKMFPPPTVVPENVPPSGGTTVTAGQIRQTEHVSLHDVPAAHPSKPSQASGPLSTPLPQRPHAEHVALQVAGAPQPSFSSQVSEPATIPSPHKVSAQAEQLVLQ